MAADIDLLFGAHRSITHSLGATVVAGGAAAVVVRDRRMVVALIAAAAYGSHILFDWLGADPRPPFGIMALWPLSQEFYVADVQIFLRVCREYWLGECWRDNAVAVGRELLVLVPVATAAAWPSRWRLSAFVAGNKG